MDKQSTSGVGVKSGLSEQMDANQSPSSAGMSRDNPSQTPDKGSNQSVSKGGKDFNVRSNC